MTADRYLIGGGAGGANVSSSTPRPSPPAKMSAPHFDSAEDDEEEMTAKVGIITGGASGFYLSLAI